MNRNQLEGKWNQVKGNYDKLIGLIQERYGYEREKAEQEVNAFLGGKVVV